MARVRTRRWARALRVCSWSPTVHQVQVRDTHPVGTRGGLGGRPECGERLGAPCPHDKPASPFPRSTRPGLGPLPRRGRAMVGLACCRVPHELAGTRVGGPFAGPRAADTVQLFSFIYINNTTLSENGKRALCAVR